MPNVAMTAADIYKWIAYGPNRVTQFFGMNNQAGILYIQLHQLTPKADGTIADATVPAIKSFQVLANAPFSFTVDLTLSDLYVAISSTEANYTAVAAAGGLDMTVVVSSDFLCTGNEVVVGDTTTAVNTLVVSNDNTVSHKLLKIIATELLGADRWIYVGGVTASNPTDLQSVKLPSGKTLTFNYGYGGYASGDPITTGIAFRYITQPPVFDLTLKLYVYNEGNTDGGLHTSTPACANLKAVYV